MITKKKLKVYNRLGGDIDALARCRKENDPIMSDEDWNLIDELRMAIHTIENANPADSFKEQIESKIRENTDSEETRKLLWKIGKKN